MLATYRHIDSRTIQVLAGTLGLGRIAVSDGLAIARELLMIGGCSAAGESVVCLVTPDIWQKYWHETNLEKTNSHGTERCYSNECCRKHIEMRHVCGKTRFTSVAVEPSKRTDVCVCRKRSVSPSGPSLCPFGWSCVILHTHMIVVLVLLRSRALCQ